MNWYSKREPILFFALLFLTIILFLYSNFSTQWSLPETLAKADLGWVFIVLSAILTLFIAHRYLFPSAILSISSSDGTTSEEFRITVLFDGRTITLDAKLPQQIRLFFWKKGEYKVYVKYNLGNGNTKCEKCESGIINLYEDRHIEIEIPFTK